MLNYYYNFASIETATNMCIQVITDTQDLTGSEPEGEVYVPITTYSEDYLCKYYDFNTGKWYYDEDMVNEWIPPEA